MISVVIADDQPLMREGLKYIIERNADVKVAGCARNGREAFELCGRLSPDVVLMDIFMPESDGIEGVKLIKTRLPHIRVLMLTTFRDRDNITRAIQYGADGYILKDVAPEDLINSIKNVYKGLKVIQEDVFTSYISNFEPGRDTDAPKPDIMLNEREIEVIRLIVRGYSNKEIAGDLKIAEGSVRNIISGILGKTGLNDRTQLAVYSIKNKII